MTAVAPDSSKYSYEILPDDDPMNPREHFDNAGEMLSFHKRYVMGDKHSYREGVYGGWEDFLRELCEEDDPVLVALPIYMYDHGGVALATTPFSCPWNSGQLGWAVMRESAIRRELGDAAAQLIRAAKEAKKTPGSHSIRRIRPTKHTAASKLG